MYKKHSKKQICLLNSSNIFKKEMISVEKRVHENDVNVNKEQNSDLRVKNSHSWANSSKKNDR